MAQIIIGLHTSIWIRPNDSLNLSLFLLKGVLVNLPNTQSLQVSYDSYLK